MSRIHHSDILVIGSGIAGLFFTLRVARHRRVALVTKKETVESNTNYAQGGIASVFGGDDSFQLHIDDTLTAGAGLCHRDIVEIVVQEGPALVSDLLALGVGFTRKDEQRLDLGREGGHSRHRIVHARDFTGREVERVLVETVRQHPNVTIYEDHIAIDLITQHNLRGRRSFSPDDIHCWGAYVLDKTTGMVERFLAEHTVITAGGCGQVYLHTTNPEIATGDGIAMAYRAGARVANMEFIQFHPTTLYHPQARSFLISEAVRGFGAVLRTRAGERFMEKHDKRMELAPRDIVARAIDAELKRSGDECVYLDLRHLDADAVRSSFPSIYQRCMDVNIDITSDLIPVVPAAHYTCGGILSDAYGRSNIRSLYVAGESAMTGLHGANRLASNSLLEALVFANRAASTILECAASPPPVDDIVEWDDSGTDNPEEWVLVSHNRREVRTLMWDYVGIVRSDLRLQRARRRIELLAAEVEDFYKRTRVSEGLIQLRNITLLGRLIIECAMRRKESRGLHHTTDYPASDPALQQRDTIISIFDQGMKSEISPEGS
ncbi:MAG: L-aspartate oxidase [Bacteroidota bacterium]|jgi:L-aspartate oxidase|nr:L-aspartate oxidase [Bacteroidota bacterium]